jgi:hypothetical protein
VTQGLGLECGPSGLLLHRGAPVGSWGRISGVEPGVDALVRWQENRWFRKWRYQRAETDGLVALPRGQYDLVRATLSPNVGTGALPDLVAAMKRGGVLVIARPASRDSSAFAAACAELVRVMRWVRAYEPGGPVDVLFTETPPVGKPPRPIHWELRRGRRYALARWWSHWLLHEHMTPRTGTLRSSRLAGGLGFL